MNHNKIEQGLRISSLMKKYLKDELSKVERQELDQWFAEHPQDRKDLQALVQQKLNAYDPNSSAAYSTDQAYVELLSRIKQGSNTVPKKSTRIYQYAAAAAVLIILSVGLLLFRPQENKPILTSLANTTKGVELTLANGKKLNLETHRNGVIASEGQAKITKENGELLSYQSTTEPQDSENSNAMNTLAIPRGRQYQLILSDGSKVWLNAQSTISFPSSFAKNERVVELTGEAYFEVNHNSAWPFRVKTRDQQVDVLGTKFNIKAYAEEIQSTTALISGSVSVSDRTNTRILKPGQLALKLNNKADFSITDTDIDEAIAWKNGKIVFKDEKIEHLTQSLARTFDVDFDIDPRIKGQHFGGSFTIKNGLTNVLRNLEQTGAIHFKVEGRRISVMP